MRGTERSGGLPGVTTLGGGRVGTGTQESLSEALHLPRDVLLSPSRFPKLGIQTPESLCFPLGPLKSE